MTTHEILVIRATRSITEVFEDKSVSLKETYNSLSGLKDEINILLETLSDDLKKEGENVIT